MRGGDTRILVTTSRSPAPRTRSLVKELELVLPGARRVTRGHLTLEELAAIARSWGAERVVVIGERRGNPSIIRVYRPSPPPRSPTLENIVTFILRGVSLSRERGVPPGPRARELIVSADEGSEDVADAMAIAFLARLRLPRVRVRPGSLEAVLESRGDEVIVEFRDASGRSVGPRLRVSRPSRMVKGAGGDA